MKVFCCPDFAIAYKNGIISIISVPDAKNFPNYKEICSFCGKRYHKK